MKIKFAICDDDVHVIEQLGIIIQQYAKNNHINVTVTSYESPIALFERLDYDVLFLDIFFDQEYLGLKAIEELREAGFEQPVIFISSLKSFTISKRGFENNVTDYLLKPLKQNEVAVVLDRTLKRLTSDIKPDGKFTIKCDNRTKIFEYEDVLYIDTIGRKRRIHTISGDSHNTNGTLKEIFEKLDNNQFIYTHNAFVVNLDKVDCYLGANVVLTNGDIIPLTRTYRKQFIEALNTYVEAEKDV